MHTLLDEQTAKASKWRIVHETLEGFKSGDVVTGDMLRETTYYQKNRMIELVPDETDISTDDTRRANAGAEGLAKKLEEAQKAERELVLAILGNDPDNIPGAEAGESDFVGDVRTYREEINGLVDDYDDDFANLWSALGMPPSDKYEAAPMVAKIAELTNRAAEAEAKAKLAHDLTEANAKLERTLAEARSAKEDGEKIVQALRTENAEQKAEIERLKGEGSKKKDKEPAKDGGD